MRAIVVEDSKAMRMILTNILHGLGFEVHEVGDGIAALDLLRKLGCPDVALVDWNMPHMNGLDLVRLIRTSEIYDPMRVMMVTTQSEVTCVQAALQAGVDEYVMKPFTADVIVEKLAMMGISVGDDAR